MTAMTGGCMCEAVRYEISAPLLGALYCHCKRCQRRSGTAFSTTALTQPGSLRLTAGEQLLQDYQPSDGWVKTFCTSCGSHVYTSHPDNPELIAVRMGGLDDDPGIRAGAHQFVAYAAAWAPAIDDGLPRFDERIPPEAFPRTDT
jgi:hypothetical protein